MKRTISLILAILLCFSLLPAAALADEEIEEIPEVAEEVETADPAPETIGEGAPAAESESEPVSEPEPADVEEPSTEEEPAAEEEPAGEEEPPAEEPAEELAVEEEEPALDGETVASGNCGDNVTWTLTDDGVLTISGTGATDNYNYGLNEIPPWASWRSSIQRVVIGDGVTRIGTFAFYSCNALQSVSFPNSLTEIYRGAFQNCKVLESVVIPGSVTSLDQDVFYQCVGLRSVTLCEGVECVGANAFSSCEKLETISIPSTLKTAEESAFAFYNNSSSVYITDLTAWCSIDFADTYSNPICPQKQYGTSTLYLNGEAVLDLVIPQGVTEVKPFTFASYANLKSVSFPATVTSIGESAFENCDGLTSLDIPQGMVQIGSSAFFNCTNLETVTVADSVTSIGDEAFIACMNLKEVTLGSGLASVGSKAFGTFYGMSDPFRIYFTGNAPQCSSDCFDSSIVIAFYPADDATWDENVLQQYGGTVTWKSYTPGDLNMLGEGTFGDGMIWQLCDSGLLTISGNGEMPDFQLNSGGTATNAPWQELSRFVLRVEIGEGVASVGDWTFFNCDNLESAVVPGSVTSIGDYAFYTCSKLQSVTLCEGLQSIESYAFAECENLTNATLPTTLETLGNSAFLNCSLLCGIALPAGLQHLDNSVFKGCEKLNSITIPESVTELGSYLFQGCSGLTSVTLPSELTTIHDYAFDGCASLQEITFPDTIYVIGNYAFRNCVKLSAVVFPGGLRRIRGNAFAGCIGLATVTIPKNTYVDGYAFSGCTGLRSATMGELSYIDSGVFQNCTSLEEVMLSGSLRSIYNQAFQGCTNLKRIDLPSGVRSIAWSAFEGSGLTRIVFPAAISGLDEEAFKDCADLKCIIFEGSAPSIEEDLFKNVTATVYYPIGDSTWTDEVRLDYGGSLTWVPVVLIDEARFPDDTFRGYVSASFDSDGDGMLSEDEIAAVTEIEINNRDLEEMGLTAEIASLQGIEYFPELTRLSVYVAGMSELDLSGHLMLQTVSCIGNGLTRLNVSDCTALENLYCGFNELTSLDVSGCTTLTSLDCSRNNLTTLDIHSCTALTSLDVAMNQLTALDVSGNTALTSLNCGGNRIAALDVSQNTELWELECYGNALTSLDVSHNTALERFGCSDNDLTTIDVRQNTALSYFACSDNPLGSIDVSWNVNLTSLYCYENGLTALDVSQNTKLWKLSCGGNSLTALDLSHNAVLGELYCADNTLTALDVSENSSLAWLYCNDNALTALDISNNTNLYGLDCSGNPIMSLDIRQNTHLIEAFNGDSEISDSKKVYYTDRWAVWPEDGDPIYYYGTYLAFDASVTILPELAVVMHPVSVAAACGDRVTFTVEAEGYGLSYQWYYRSATATKFSAVTNGTGNSETYSFKLSETNAGRTVYCEVTDSSGNTVNSECAAAYIACDPEIMAQPTNQTANEGDRVTFTVEAAGNGLTYQWYYKNAGSDSFKPLNGATSASYSFKLSASNSGRQVYCVVTDAFGETVQSETATAYIELAPVELTITSQPTNQRANIKQRVEFTVEAAGGTGELTYQWYYKSPTASKFAPVNGDAGIAPTYSFKLSAANAGRMLYCVVTDGDGNSVTSDTVVASAAEGPEITGQPTDASAAIGGKVSFKVTAKGGTGELTYQWYYKSATATKFSPVSGTAGQAATYTFKLSDKNAGRQLYCVITDEAGISVVTDIVTASRK